MNIMVIILNCLAGKKIDISLCKVESYDLVIIQCSKCWMTFDNYIHRLKKWRSDGLNSNWSQCDDHFLLKGFRSQVDLGSFLNQDNYFYSQGEKDTSPSIFMSLTTKFGISMVFWMTLTHQKCHWFIGRWSNNVFKRRCWLGLN